MDKLVLSFAIQIAMCTYASCQIVEGRGVRITGMNMTGSDGFVGDKRTYNQAVFEFAPGDYKVKTKDLSQPFQIEGDTNGLGLYRQCNYERGILLYDSTGPTHISFTCTDPKQVCALGSCRPNTRGPTFITSETTFQNDGGVYRLRGKASSKYTIAGKEIFKTVDEQFDFSIDPQGNCHLEKYREQYHSEERILNPSPYDYHEKPSTIVYQSEPFAKCDIFKDPRS